MYDSLICAVVIVTFYFAMMAVIGHFRPGLTIFSVKAAVCLVLGAILGILVGGWLFGVDRTLGYLGVGVSIGLMYILFFSGVIQSLISRLPDKVKKGFRTFFKWFRIVLIAAVIVCAVMGVLTLWGV